VTKKDYEAFAEMFADVETSIIAPIRSTKSRVVARTVARHIQTRAADIFADDNPRFSRARFFAACTRAEKDGHDGEYYGSPVNYLRHPAWVVDH
jgi:hypothetical protein